MTRQPARLGDQRSVGVEDLIQLAELRDFVQSGGDLPITARLDVLEELAQPDQAVAQPLVQGVIQLGPDREPVASGGQRTDGRDRAEIPHGQAEPQ